MSNDSENKMRFFDWNSVIVYNPKKNVHNCYAVYHKVINILVEFVLQITSSEIIKGNQILKNQIYEFNGLIIGEPSVLYEMKEEDIYSNLINFKKNIMN